MRRGTENWLLLPHAYGVWQSEFLPEPSQSPGSDRSKSSPTFVVG